LSSCFPHLCWVPTHSFSCCGAELAPHPPPSVDQFQEVLDPSNCPFLCRAHVMLHVCVDCCMFMSMLHVHVNAGCPCWWWCSIFLLTFLINSTLILGTV
jgi:hypothetical protein